MKKLYSYLLLLSFSVSLAVMPVLSLADPSPSPSPSASSYPVVVQIQGVANQAAVSNQDFLSSVLASVKSFGGLPWVARIACIVLLIIAAMKVSVLDGLIFNKLGAFKAWAAPILGLAAGLLVLGLGGHITLAGLFAYLGSGSGALLLHELLDTVKAIPGLGSVYVSLIATIENALGGTPSPAAPSSG